MANAAHLKLIHRGVKRWNHWRKRAFSEVPDLSGADLGGLNLVGIDLTKANLERTNLRETNLREAVLRSAVLTASDCRGADFSEADLSAAHLTQADLRWARLFKTDLSRANLREASLDQVWGEQAFLVEASLVLATMVGAIFSQAILTGAHLEEANLSQASLVKADLSFIDLRGANLTQANLSKTICVEANLRGANLSGSNFYCANCQRSNFSQAVFHNANLGAGNFNEADFSYTDLTGSYLADAKVKNAKFYATHLQDVDWGTQNFLERLELEGKLEGVQWSLPSLDLTGTLSPKGTAPFRANGEGEAAHSPVMNLQPLTTVQSSEAVLPITTPLRSPFVQDLNLPTPINWIALAIAFYQGNQTMTQAMSISRLEVKTDGMLSIRVELNPETPDPSLGEWVAAVKQRYDTLCTVLCQTLPPGLDKATPAQLDRTTSPQPIHQLLMLLISNLV